MIEFNPDRKELIFELSDSPFVRHIKNIGKPLCLFIAGFLTGYFSLSFGEKVITFETKCQGMDSELCEFMVRFLE